MTKGEINRLGDEIRSEQNDIGINSLEKLQDYRTSHKTSLSETFKILLDIRKRKSHNAIVTFRIKRFESIIGKLERYPDMEFSRMWDIGGCRVIVKNNDEVYKFRDEIAKVLNIRKLKDYIKNPQTDGYKSLHLYADSPIDNRVIEIQIRNQKDHNWATLVEISDLLFDSKLKEYGKDKTLLRFHFLLSKEDELTFLEKKELATIIYKYQYVDELSKVFTRNYLEVRQQWTNIETKPKYRFFLIETSKHNIPKIEAFESFNEAETSYFKKFQENSDSNVVLTHLPKPDYNQISIAYSNYILTMHTFMDDFSIMFENLILESLKYGRYFEYIKMLDLHFSIISNHIGNAIKEVNFNNNVTNEISNGVVTRKISNGWVNNKKAKKAKEWKNDIRTKLKQIDKNLKRFQRLYATNLPENKIKKYFVIQITRYITWKYERKIRNLLK